MASTNAYLDYGREMAANNVYFQILRKSLTDYAWHRAGGVIYSSSPEKALDASTRTTNPLHNFIDSERVLVRNESTGVVYEFEVAVPPRISFKRI